MKNCIVKMVVKNKSRANPEDLNQSQGAEQSSTYHPINNSKNSDEKQGLSLQIKNLLSGFQKLLKQSQKPQKIHQIEPRDRKIIFQLPLIPENQKLEKRVLQQWITNLCKEVFSAAFHYFQRGNMNYDQAKIYCSENIISNIIRLTEIYQLDSKDIKMIDQHIQNGVCPYLLTKYPMTETQVVNKALQGQIKEIDNIEALQNDIFFYSEDSYGFEYRETGNYNDLIMKLMNDLMKRIDEKQIKIDMNNRQKTFYQDFYQFMQKSFQIIQSRDGMEFKTINTIKNNKTNKDNKENKEDLTKQIEDQKYKARVKAYTSWAIGRKISENVPQYTEAEIASMHMTIKSPAILRILTKWCEQLWSKFEKKNYFLDRTENVKCQKGKNVNIYFAWMKTIVNGMIQQQKLQIEKFMQQIFENSYDQQAIHCFRSLKGNFFNQVQKIQKAAGVFTIKIVNNLHSYILHYLNRIIHGLLKVSKRVYDKQLIGRARWTSPPNLISFKIGDLMRCKIGSQEKEILRLFKQYTYLSQKHPETFKIIRIKNRLKEGTNDILINIRFKNVFICEAQLAVNSDHSNFIKCSNKYNHFIYEVKRSIFGPISELCSIWRSLDGRCKIYEKIAISKKQHIVIPQTIELRSGKTEKCYHQAMVKYNQPFVCSSCHQTYSHSNYIWPHRKCSDCQKYILCCKCQLKKQDETSLKQRLLKGQHQLKKIVNKVSQDDEIPKYGLCFSIQSKLLHMQKFAKHFIKGKIGLYYRKNHGDIELITDLNTKKQIQSFREKYVIFQIPVDEGPRIVNISSIEAKNDYLLPKMVKSIYKKQKQFISLIGEDINDDTLKDILQSSNKQSYNKIKCLQLPDNNISDISFICKNFKNLTKLVLSRNKIKNIEQIFPQLSNLQQLNIRDNAIKELPINLFNLFKLESLNMRKNSFTQLPQEISKLTNLTKLQLNQLGLKKLPKSLSKMQKIQYLDISTNDLRCIPSQIRELKKLFHLDVSQNNVQEIPQWIGQLKQLKVLQLNFNKLKSMPQSIVQLTNLTDLSLKKNIFEQLNFRCPPSLSVAVFNKNNIRHISQIFFVNCQNLIKIQLDKNEITSLPHNMGVICSKMKNLSLNQNKLTNLSNIFGVFLPSLELLKANKNKFKAFPLALKHCTKLIELHLSNNPLQGQISEQFLQQSEKIQKIDISKTKISKIPYLDKAPTLKRIDFSQTPITVESLEIIGSLQFIEEINLQEMNLNSIPTSFKQLHALHILNLKNNHITQIEEDFFVKLTHLRQIHLSGNKLKRLPSSLKFCKRIKEIYCKKNQLAEFPEAIYSFGKIQKIDLSFNQIQKLQSKIPLPITLKQLYLNNNRISSISEVVFKNSDNLVKLSFLGNKLTSAPKSLRYCVKLSEIDFNDNPIVLNNLETVRQIFDMYKPIEGIEQQNVVNCKDIFLSMNNNYVMK